MMLISFTDSEHYDFVMQFVRATNAELLGIKPRAHSLEIEAENPIIGRLLQRIRDRRSIIFPYVSGEHHSWIITAPTPQQRDLTLMRISRFVVPTYASCTSENHQPQLKNFEAGSNILQQLGSHLYPDGYYSLYAPSRYFKVMLRHIELWMNLEEERPELHGELSPTYSSLYEIFQNALSATNWPEAEQCLHEMQKLHLITADNFAFLQIQLLSQQQRWPDIWLRADFAQLARIRMPKAVRAALISAFHTSVLLPLEQEQQWEAALESFKQHQAYLGLLLVGRFGLTQLSVLQVFAYQAALDKDKEHLTQIYNSTEDKKVHECIQNLQQISIIESKELSALPTIEENLAPSPAPLQRAQLALISFDYDTALRFGREVMQPIEKAIILLQIASYCSDVSLATEALITYWDLPTEEQVRLENAHIFISRSLKYLGELTNSPNDAEAVPHPEIHTWLEWFEVAGTRPEEPALLTSINTLLANRDSNQWNNENIITLNDKLFAFLFDGYFTPVRYKKSILQYFVNSFLQDEDFPKSDGSYVDVYETLFEGLRETYENNQNLDTGLELLRLADALLRQSPLRSERIFADLTKWCPQPIPALENWALETADLFAEYGLQPALLFQWYRDWVSALLDLPNSRERVNLETWRLFGQWIQPGADILQKLERSLAKVIQNEISDAIADLPIGYRIGILTLRKSSAQRTTQLLLERNNTLDIRTCLEKDLNEQVKALVQNSDMVVVVTTCITHALTYGIAPFLKTDPVRPQSSGSTSMVRAIEERARQRNG